MNAKFAPPITASGLFILWDEHHVAKWQQLSYARDRSLEAAFFRR